MPALALLWRVARISIPLPLGLIAAAAVWLWLDKASAVRTAVNDAVRELVAGSQIEALQEQLETQRQVNEAWRRLSEANARRYEKEREARMAFEQELEEARRADEDTQEEINDLSSKPAQGVGTVGPDLGRRLRNR